MIFDEQFIRAIRSHKWISDASIVAKNEALLQVLQSNTAPDQKEFRNHQRIVKKAMEMPKKIGYAELQEKKQLWRMGVQCGENIIKLQQTHGRRPTKRSAALKEAFEGILDIMTTGEV